MAASESHQKLAKVAGATFLLAMIVVAAANYGASFRLVVESDPASTAQNIAANETLFRLNIVANLIHAALGIVLLSALYTILAPAGRTIAIVAALARLVMVLAWAMSSLHMLNGLRLLGLGSYLEGDAGFLSAIPETDRQVLAMLQLDASLDAYYVGLPFWGLASALFSCLWLCSGYVPRWLAIFGIAASAWCAVCALAYISIPGFHGIVNAYLFDVPMVLFELILGVWLITKGLRTTASPG